MPTLREKFDKFLKDPKQTYHGTGSDNINLNLLTLYEMMQMYGENAEYDLNAYTNSLNELKNNESAKGIADLMDSAVQEDPNIDRNEDFLKQWSDVLHRRLRQDAEKTLGLDGKELPDPEKTLENLVKLKDNALDGSFVNALLYKEAIQSIKTKFTAPDNLMPEGSRDFLEKLGHHIISNATDMAAEGVHFLDETTQKIQNEEIGSLKPYAKIPGAPQKIAKSMFYNQTTAGNHLRICQDIISDLSDALSGDILSPMYDETRTFGKALREESANALQNAILREDMDITENWKNKDIDDFLTYSGVDFPEYGITLKQGIIPNGLAEPVSYQNKNLAEIFGMTDDKMLDERYSWNLKAQEYEAMQDKFMEDLGKLYQYYQAHQDSPAFGETKNEGIHSNMERFKKYFDPHGALGNENGKYNGYKAMSHKDAKEEFGALKAFFNDNANKDKTVAKGFSDLLWDIEQHSTPFMNSPKGVNAQEMASLYNNEAIRRGLENKQPSFEKRLQKQNDILGTKLDDAIAKHKAGHLHLRGSKAYDIVGSNLNVLKSSLDAIKSMEERRLANPEGFNSMQEFAYKNYLETLKLNLKSAKEANKAYLDHKSGTKEYGYNNTNSNAKKRIEAVRASEEAVDALSEIVEDKLRAIHEEQIAREQAKEAERKAAEAKNNEPNNEPIRFTHEELNVKPGQEPKINIPGVDNLMGNHQEPKIDIPSVDNLVEAPQNNIVDENEKELGSIKDYQNNLQHTFETLTKMKAPKTDEEKQEFERIESDVRRDLSYILATKSVFPQPTGKSLNQMLDEAPQQEEQIRNVVEEKNDAIESAWSEIVDSDPMDLMMGNAKTPKDLAKLAKLGCTKNGAGLMMEYAKYSKQAAKNQEIKDKYSKDMKKKDDPTLQTGEQMINFDL